MYRIAPLIVFTALSGAHATDVQEKPAVPEPAQEVRETRYLAFQIFTNFTSDPKDAQTLSHGMKEPVVPGSAALRKYVLDIKTRIGTVGTGRTRLAVMLGPLCFDQSDAEITKYIERAFALALETDVAVGFHIDDSMFWRSRKDLWGDPKNVEALDWDGTANTGRRLDWSKTPLEIPPQMCFNSEAIKTEVRKRSALIGRAVTAGVRLLQERNKPELFAGVIAGWETMIGQDFKTGKYLGYRALLNRGFSRDRQPKDVDLERESIVKEFIDLWATGLADAGVPRQQIYSHTAFLSRRAFNLGGDKAITYMKKDTAAAYSQHNHFAPPAVAFGANHRPGFSTYPQPGLFDDIYEQVAEHKQVGWASCEGTNMQPGTGPGQTGMNMETYLAKTFNHGGTLVNIYSWGIGGEAMKTMDYRRCTENDEALNAYRKFLRGEPLVEAKETSTLMERLPPKVQKIQKDFPAWVEKTGNTDAVALMKKMQEHYKAKNFEEVEKAADAILKLMGVSEPAPGEDGPAEAVKRLRHELGGSFLVTRDKVQDELKMTRDQKEKLERHIPDLVQSFQKLDGLNPEDRKKEVNAFRQKAQEKLAAALKETLSDDQRSRLRELVLQREGLFGDGAVWTALQITDEQRRHFVSEIQQMQKTISPLIEEAKKSGNPDEIRPKVLKLRIELQTKLETRLTDAQKKQWKEMLGKPVDQSILFDDVPPK